MHITRLLRQACHPKPLLDKFNRRHNYLRLSLTDRCNFKCQYCMPENVQFAPNSHLLSAEEFHRLCQLHIQHFAVNKIRITGGEPMARRDFRDILQYFKGDDYRDINFGITTNGLLLHRYFDDLVEANVLSINLSVDSLIPQKFSFITRQPLRSVEKVYKNMHDILLHNLDKVRVKLNVVLMKNLNDDEIGPFCELAKSHPIEVRFLEYMPFDGNEWSKKKVCSVEDVEARLHAEGVKRIAPDSIHDVAKLYTGAGWQGRIGVISTVTSPFCGGCNRIRITADGALKNCLFSEGELNLRDLMRAGCSDDELVAAIRGDFADKKFSRNLDKLSSRPMVKIGG